MALHMQPGPSYPTLTPRALVDAPLLPTAFGLPRSLALLQQPPPPPPPFPKFWEKPVAEFPLLWALSFVL